MNCPHCTRQLDMSALAMSNACAITNPFERKLLALLLEAGLTYEDIAEKLGKTQSNISTRAGILRERLGVRNRAELIALLVGLL